MQSTPHYLLFSEATCSPSSQTWRFVLQNVETSRRMVVSDDEPSECGERLELLAVVRGLEALDGPSRVTLVTKSRYVSRGIRTGLNEWRANDWQWERFGRIVPVKDCDLWQRVDRALLFHKVDCQAWQFEVATAVEPTVCRAPEVETPVIGAPADVLDRSRCSETLPSPCEPESHRLVPTRRRVASTQQPIQRRVRKHAARSATKLGGVAAAVAQRAATWSESLRALGNPLRQLAQGAA